MAKTSPFQPLTQYKAKCVRLQKFQKQVDQISRTPSAPPFPIVCVTGRPIEEQRKLAMLNEKLMHPKASKLEWFDNLDLDAMSQQEIFLLWDNKICPRLDQYRASCDEIEASVNRAEDPGTKFVLAQRWEFMKERQQEVEGAAAVLDARMLAGTQNARQAYIRAREKGDLEAAIAFTAWRQYEEYALRRVAFIDQLLYSAQLLDEGDARDEEIAKYETELEEAKLLIPDEAAGEEEDAEVDEGVSASDLYKQYAKEAEDGGRAAGPDRGEDSD